MPVTSRKCVGARACGSHPEAASSRTSRSRRVCRSLKSRLRHFSHRVGWAAGDALPSRRDPGVNGPGELDYLDAAAIRLPCRWVRVFAVGVFLPDCAVAPVHDVLSSIFYCAPSARPLGHELRAMLTDGFPTDLIHPTFAIGIGRCMNLPGHGSSPSLPFSKVVCRRLASVATCREWRTSLSKPARLQSYLARACGAPAPPRSAADAAYCVPFGSEGLVMERWELLEHLKRAEQQVAE